MNALVTQLVAALESASQDLSILDPVGNSHDTVIIDEALAAARIAESVPSDEVALAMRTYNFSNATWAKLDAGTQKELVDGAAELVARYPPRPAPPMDQVALATVFAGVYCGDRRAGVSSHVASMNAGDSLRVFIRSARDAQQV